jgi:hypothetical protein
VTDGAERRPGLSDRGDADHRIADEITTNGIRSQLRRRRAASRRLPPLASGLHDPLDSVSEPLTDAELASWRAAWWHTRWVGLEPVIPERIWLAAGSRAGDPALHRMVEDQEPAGLEALAGGWQL